jgi:calcium-dependent protein kinase
VIDKTKLTKEDIDSLRNEVKTMETVDHPNIVKYFETYDEPKYIYLCMELCTGGELFEKVSSKDHHLSEKTCSEYM